MATPNEKRLAKLRNAWEKAVEKDKPKDALAALEGLEELEPREPRWPHRRGDVLKRLGRSKEAEAPYIRAIELYSQQGFIARAIAVAKVLIEINPARAGIMDRLDEAATASMSRRSPTLTLPPGMAPPSSLEGSLSSTGKFPSYQSQGSIRPDPMSSTGTHARAPESLAPRSLGSPPSAAGMSPESRSPLSHAPASAAARPFGVDTGTHPAMPMPGRTVSGSMPSVSPSATLPARPPVPAQGPPSGPVRSAAPPPPLPPKPSPNGAQAIRPPAAPNSIQVPKSPGVGGFQDDVPTRIIGIRLDSVTAIAAAEPLHVIEDADPDEVRFDDAEEQGIELDVLDLDKRESDSMELAEIYVDPDEDDDRAQAHIAAMSGTRLFSALPHEALVELSKAAVLEEYRDKAVLFRKGDTSAVLYVVVEGKARLSFSDMHENLEISGSQIFGEDCLLERSLRDCECTALGRLVVLRISKLDLDRIVRGTPAVGDVLFGLLVERLLAKTVQISPLFNVFDPETRTEVAKLFEMRRAAAGVKITEAGKRSDGLYLFLAGDLVAECDGKKERLMPGTLFGQEALLSHSPAVRTIEVTRDAVLLRLPASRFGTFAMQYPPALAHLAELASASHS